MSFVDSNKVILENIYLSNMTRQKDQACNCYSISEIVSQDRLKSVLSYLLFAHAFTGCDTTSAIHKFGKNTIFRKLESSKPLRSIGDIFSKSSNSRTNWHSNNQFFLKPCIHQDLRCLKFKKENMRT